MRERGRGRVQTGKCIERQQEQLQQIAVGSGILIIYRTYLAALLIIYA